MCKGIEGRGGTSIAEITEYEMRAIYFCRASVRGHEQDDHNRTAGCQNQVLHQGQGEEEACRTMLIGDSPSTHPARETWGAKAAWWWASRKVSSGQGSHRRLQKWEMRGRRGSSLKLREQLSSFIQETCCLFFLWSKPKHHFNPVSADSAWQRQFRLL